MAGAEFPPVNRPDGWSIVEVPGENGQPGARFWVPTDGLECGSGADTAGSQTGYASDGVDLNTVEGRRLLEERRAREAGTEDL